MTAIDIRRVWAAAAVLLTGCLGNPNVFLCDPTTGRDCVAFDGGATGGGSGGGAGGGTATGGGTGGSCASTCTPPAPFCVDGDTLQSAGLMACTGTSCQFHTIVTQCTRGCVDGACIGEPCAGVLCEAPPSSTCLSPTVLRAFVSPGTCSGGGCSYASADVSCATGCANGACLGNPCIGRQCNAPPAAECVGSSARTYSSAGTCDPLSGACSYASTDTACANGCNNGHCVQDLCAGVSCDAPSDTCVDAQTVRSRVLPGSCDPLSGACGYTTRLITCPAGQMCAQGVCVTPPPSCNATNCTGCCVGTTCVELRDQTNGQCGTSALACGACGSSTPLCMAGVCTSLCVGVTCNTPPAASCLDTSTLQSWGASGTCNPATGGCSYTPVQTPCGAGQVCSGGACVRAPAASVTVMPGSVQLMPLSTQAFTAVARDASGTALPTAPIVWSVVSGGGSIAPDGTFTAGTTPGAYTNTVRATVDGVSGLASVTVQQPPCNCTGQEICVASVCRWNDPSLTGLTVAPASFTFSSTTTTYVLAVPAGTSMAFVTPTLPMPARATVTVNGLTAASGMPSAVSISAPTWLNVVVTAESGATRTYSAFAVPDVAQAAYVKASNTGADDGFGISVALSRDGATLAVGAYGEKSAATGVNGNQGDNSASAAGAVYVYARSGGAWVPQAYVKASNTGADDMFGYAVALSADGNTLAVGAIGEDSAAAGINGNQSDNSAPDSGAVYVFTRSNGIWSQQAYVKPTNTGAGDRFGVSVALSGDSSTLSVGAWREDGSSAGVGGNPFDNGLLNSGAAYVFTRSGASWAQQVYLKASNPDIEDSFGISTALSADGNTLVVGNSWEDSNGTGPNANQANNLASASGAAYVFVRSAGVWTQQVYLKASNAGAGDLLGYSVALSADGDTLAVGAHGEGSSAAGINGNQSDNSAVEAGAVFIFTRSGATWAQQAYVKSSNPQASDIFGYNVSLSSDGNALAVGAHWEDSSATGINGNTADNSATDSGAVYLFTRTGSTWAQQNYVKASNTAAQDGFGSVLSLSGDGNTLACGAMGEDSAATGVGGNQGDNAASSAGAVYLFQR